MAERDEIEQQRDFWKYHPVLKNGIRINNGMRLNSKDIFLKYHPVLKNGIERDENSQKISFTHARLQLPSLGCFSTVT